MNCKSKITTTSTAGLLYAPCVSSLVEVVGAECKKSDRKQRYLCVCDLCQETQLYLLSVFFPNTALFLKGF